MLALITYITPLLITLLLSYKGITFILKLLFSLRHSDEATIEKTLEEKIPRWKESLEQPKHKIPLDQLKRTKPFLFPYFWSILNSLSVIYIAPIGILRMTLSFRFGTIILWKIPASLYEVWDFFFLFLSFYYAYKHKTILAIALAIVVGLKGFIGTVDIFERKNGIFRLLTMPKHKLRFTNIIIEGVSVILAFAAIYYSIDKIVPNAFTSNLSILDSIYFSIMTVATVGYGDISPLSFSTKLLSVIEVGYGFVFVIIVIATFIPIWINRQIEENKPQDNRLNTNQPPSN